MSTGWAMVWVILGFLSGSSANFLAKENLPQMEQMLSVSSQLQEAQEESNACLRSA